MNNLNASGIYAIRNIVNGKMYIGSAVKLKTRKTNHFSSLRKNIHHNTHLQSAFNKYGEENFVFEVLEIAEISYLAYLEQRYIEWYDTKLLYNLRINAQNNFGIKRLPSVGVAIRDRLLGKRLTEHQKIKLKEACKNNKWITDGNNTARPVLQKDMNGTVVICEYLSVSKAAKQLGISNGTIVRACNNPNRTAGGYKWEYKFPKTKEKVFKPIHKIDKKTLTIIEHYESIKIAEKETGVSYLSIWNCCNGKRKTAGGYKWEYK